MKILRALMLVLTLSVCAYAGNMDNGAPVPPPSTQTAGEMDNGVAGNMDNGVSANAPVTESTVTAVALNVLQSALSVL